MITLYKIDAVHDIFKRVIKSNLSGNKMVNLYRELKDAGYEHKNIKIMIMKRK